MHDGTFQYNHATKSQEIHLFHIIDQYYYTHFEANSAQKCIEAMGMNRVYVVLLSSSTSSCKNDGNNNDINNNHQ